MEMNLTTTKGTARLAGLIYFVWIIVALYGMAYLPSQIDMKGDATSIAQNVLSHETLFRTGIFNDLIVHTIWIVMVLVFYRLFKPVNEFQAKLLVALVLVQIPVVFFNEAFNVAALKILLNKDLLGSFTPDQRQEIVSLFLKFGDYAVLTLEIFWGLWLFPLAYLVYKSRFLPKFIGIWLMLNGIAYVILSGVSIVIPEYKHIVFNISIPAMVGEVVLTLWLLIMGAKEQKVNTVVA